MERVIVSRHPATVEFIRRELPEFADAPAIASARPEDVAGREVAGNLPLDLAAQAHRVHAVCFRNGSAPRGQDFTLADMDRAGAHIRTFRVLAEPVCGAAHIVNLAITAYHSGRQDALAEAHWGQERNRSSEFLQRARDLCHSLGL